jgi:hypothetical protein
VTKVIEYLRAAWWRLLIAAMIGGVISGLLFAIAGVPGSHAIATYLAHGKEPTELGDAALAIYAFFAFGSTGFIAGFSGTYGIARRSGYAPLVITCIAGGINVLGFFVPTGGYALAPFCASIVIGLSLTVVWLILRSAQAKS